MAASALISVDPATIQIQAGGRASARVTVLNQGDTVGQYGLDVSGIDPTWIKLDPVQMGIFPGDKAAAQLNFHTSANSVSATYRVIIRAVNQLDSSDTTLATLNLSVQSTGLGGNATMVSEKPVVAQPEQNAARRVPSNQTQKPVGAASKPTRAPGPAQVAMQAASTSGQLQMTSDRDDLKIPPGNAQTINLGFSNTGGVGINLELDVKGPPESWLAFTPGESLTLAPGEANAVALAVSVPSQAPLGYYPLTILVQEVDDPSLNARINLMLEVIKPGDIMIAVDPPQVEGEMSGVFNILLNQTGLTPVTVSLTGSDDNGWLDYSFSPPNVTVPAGGKASSRLTVGAKQSLTEMEARAVPFVVSASSADGVTAVATARGSLVQTRAAPGTLVLQPEEQRNPAQAVFVLRLLNPGASSQAFRLSASDSDGGCSYQFDAESVNVPPGREASTHLYVTPLQYLDGGAITHTFAVTARPVGSPGQALRAEGRYIQVAIQKPGLSLSPTSQSSAGPAAYSVVVSNPRPTPLHIELRPYDAENLCRFAINPSGLDIPPDSQAAARLEVDPASDLLRGESQRMCAFTVAGYSNDMPNPVVVEGSLLLVRGFTWRSLLPWVIAAVVILGIAGLVLLFFAYYYYFG
jgi:hypothetical protein